MALRARLRTLLGAALTAAVVATRVSAQPLVSAPRAPAPASVPAPSPEALAIARSDSAFLRGDVAGALSPLRPYLDADRADPALLWRGARAYIALAILAPARAESETQLLRATTYAQHAVQLAPQEITPRYWLAVATGRRALRGDFRRILPLAVETYNAAQWILKRDSLHAGAHDIVGKLYSEVRKLPWVVRKLAATVTRQDVLRLASWEAAEFHLRRAIALDSSAVIYQADLAQLYLRMDRLPESRAVLQQLERLPNRTPADTLFKREVRSWIATRERSRQ